MFSSSSSVVRNLVAVALVGLPTGLVAGKMIAYQLPQAPSIVINPTNQTVSLNSLATFTSTGTGYYQPTEQWQVSIDGGNSFNNIPGATGTSYSVVGTKINDGYQYRAVFTNAAGTADSAAATLLITAKSCPTCTPIAAPVVQNPLFNGSVIDNSTYPCKVNIAQTSPIISSNVTLIPGVCGGNSPVTLYGYLRNTTCNNNSPKLFATPTTAVFNSKLQTAATAEINLLAQGNYVGPVDTNGKTPIQRVQQYLTTATTAAEIIIVGCYGTYSPLDIATQIANDPNSVAIVSNPNWTDVGISFRNVQFGTNTSNTIPVTVIFFSK